MTKFVAVLVFAATFTAWASTQHSTETQAFTHTNPTAAAAKHQPKQAAARAKAAKPHAAQDRYQACLADATASPESCWELNKAAYAESHPE